MLLSGIFSSTIDRGSKFDGKELKGHPCHKRYRRLLERQLKFPEKLL